MDAPQALVEMHNVRPLSWCLRHTRSGLRSPTMVMGTLGLIAILVAVPSLNNSREPVTKDAPGQASPSIGLLFRNEGVEFTWTARYRASDDELIIGVTSCEPQLVITVSGSELVIP